MGSGCGRCRRRDLRHPVGLRCANFHAAGVAHTPSDEIDLLPLRFVAADAKARSAFVRSSRYFTLTFTASERVTRKDETTSAHGVRRLAAAVRSWVIRGAEEREQSPALHSLERRSSSAVTASTFKKYL